MISAIRPAPAAVTVRVPAKVNLQLAVGPARADGYHSLVTVFHAVSLFDEVTVGRGQDVAHRHGRGRRGCPARPVQPGLAGGQRAGRAAGLRGAAVEIQIRKRIPVAAGLAGGSADAAATLVACNELWQTGLSQDELIELAAGPGQRRPVRPGRRHRGRTRPGRGADACACSRQLPLGACVRPCRGLSTAQVYATCDRLRAARAAAGASASRASPSSATPLMAALRSGDPARLGPLLSNDLQPAALSLQPELRRALAAGREHGALGAIVSGSGPTCAFLAQERGARTRARGRADRSSGVCRAVARASGPAPGAAVSGHGAVS